MRFINAIEISKSFFVMALLLCIVSSAVGQENGEADLDKAFDLKIKAKSLRDLESVVKLCKSSIKKGLEEDDVEQANQLASTTLYEHAEQLTREIFKTQGKNTRFKFYRREAMKRLDEAVEFDPELAAAYSMMAQLNVLPGGDPDVAKENIDKAIELSAGEPEELSRALLTRARLSAISDPEAALADVNEAIKIDDSNKDARILRAEYNFRAGKITKAVEDLDVILAGSDFNGYFKQAQNLRIQAGGLAMSDRIEDEDERAEAVSEIRETALRYIEKAIELDDQKREAYDLKASIHVDSEDWDEAIEAVDESLELDEKNIAAIRLRSSILASQEKMDEAIEDANRAYDLDPESLETLLFRNQLHETNGDMESAIKDAELMVELRPEADGLQRNLARAYVLNDQPSKAIKVYDRLLDQVYRDNAWENQPPQQGFVFALARMETLGSRANSFLSQGNHKKAVADYEEAVELFDVLKEIQEEIPSVDKIYEGDQGILNNFAWVLATSTDDDVRDGEKAIELATQACELTDYKMPHILSTLASAYAEDGDFDEAKKWIEKGLEVNESLLLEDGSNEKDIKSQADSLNDELASYEEEKPWREEEDVEGEKKKAEGKDEDGDEDGDDDEDGDEDHDDDDEEHDESEEDKKSDDKKKKKSSGKKKSDK